MSDSFIFAEHQKVEGFSDDIKRQVLGFDGQPIMVKVWFDEGSIGYEHTHFHSQTRDLESDEFEVNMGDEVRLLRADGSFRH